MIEMFRYLMSVLEKDEQKVCRNYAILSFICPMMDIFCYSELIHIVNTIDYSNQVSDKLISFTLLLGGISVLKIFVDIKRCKMSNHFVYNNAHRLSEKLYEVLIKEDLEQHNQKSVSQAWTIIRNDTEICINIIKNCISLCIDIITLCGYSAALIYVAKWIGAVSSILLILGMGGIFLLYQKQIKLYGEKVRTSGIRINAQIAATYGVFKEMKISNKGNILLQKYENTSKEYMQTQREFGYKNGIIGIYMRNSVLVIMFAVLSLFLVVGSGNLPAVLGLIITYATALIRMVGVAQGIIGRANSLEFSKKSYEVFRKEYNKYKRITEKEKLSENVRKKEIHLKKGLAVRNLTFSYNEHTPIFQNVSLDIPVGYSIAVTGVSGAGKTTFLDLVLGLLKPQSGSIFYDDYDIITQQDAEGKCRANIGEIVSYIPQIVYLNGETIRNNVAFFEGETEIDDEKVRKALECALIWEDVSRMPEGINTLIGENGTAISGGQRQRIALARALYNDFELLIMDEATTALDMETESAVIDSIRQVKGDKTILMVTHHMSLAQECDIIYQIENRKIIRVK